MVVTPETPATTPRLTVQLDAVRRVMADGAFRTLDEITAAAAPLVGSPCSTPSISARLRDLRKKQYGGYAVHRRHVGGGLWKYRVCHNTNPTTEATTC
jgi:hypothetical protein